MNRAGLRDETSGPKATRTNDNNDSKLITQRAGLTQHPELWASIGSTSKGRQHPQQGTRIKGLSHEIKAMRMKPFLIR